MGQRGRKSAASLSVAAVTHLPNQRPEPPADLTQEQADEWRAVVGRMPVDWFPRETWELLANYCRHVVKARTLAGVVDAFDPEWFDTEDGLKRYDKLTQMAEREARALSSLATRMRLTQQSRHKAETAATAANRSGLGVKPWQVK